MEIVWYSCGIVVYVFIVRKFNRSFFSHHCSWLFFLFINTQTQIKSNKLLSTFQNASSVFITFCDLSLLQTLHCSFVIKVVIWNKWAIWKRRKKCTPKQYPMCLQFNSFRTTCNSRHVVHHNHLSSYALTSHKLIFKQHTNLKQF